MMFKVIEENRNKSGIYKILNIINGKFYIGSSKNFQQRFNSHLMDKERGLGRSKLYNALKKYREEAFHFSILEICPIINLIEREQYYLDLLKPYHREIGYNICTKAYSRINVRHSKITRAKISLAKIKKIGRNFRVCDPNGKIHEGRGITKFANEHYLSYSGFKMVLDGKNNIYKGWHLPEYKGSLKRGCGHWPEFFDFINEKGVPFKIHRDNIKEFLKNNKYKKFKFMSWYMGKRNKYRRFKRI